MKRKDKRDLARDKTLLVRVSAVQFEDVAQSSSKIVHLCFVGIFYKFTGRLSTNPHRNLFKQAESWITQEHDSSWQKAINGGSIALLDSRTEPRSCPRKNSTGKEPTRIRSRTINSHSPFPPLI
jgi:hypothetical protein